MDDVIINERGLCSGHIMAANFHRDKDMKFSRCDQNVYSFHLKYKRDIILLKITKKRRNMPIQYILRLRSYSFMFNNFISCRIKRGIICRLFFMTTGPVKL